MVSTHQKQFLKQHSLKENAVLTLEDISTLSGIPVETLYIIYSRGEVLERTAAVLFSFHKVVNRKPKGKGMERVYAFIAGKPHEDDVAIHQSLQP